jgi:excisionase family DNA binding protein
MTTATDDRLLTTAEVAERCRVSDSTVRYWRAIRYGPPSFRVGRRVLYREAAVREWLDETETAQTAAANG